MGKYKKILQSVLDSGGNYCVRRESDCVNCPCRKYCGDDDDKHYELVEKWFKGEIIAKNS